MEHRRIKSTIIDKHEHYMQFHDLNGTTDLTAIGLNNKVSKHSVGQPGVLFRVYQMAAKQALKKTLQLRETALLTYMCMLACLVWPLPKNFK